MKKAKKIWSLVLAVLMVVSVMPMAMAADFSVSDFNAAMTDFNIYTSNVYEDDENAAMAVLYLYAEKLTPVMEKYPDLDFGDVEVMKANPEAGYEYTVAFNEATALIEEAIAEGTIVVLIDTSKAISAYYLASDYSEEEIEAIMDKIPADLVAAAEESLMACDEIMCAEDPTVYTQADYDEASAGMISFYTQLYNCLGGVHDCGAKKDNGDNTHTAVCEFCQAEETTEHTYESGKCECGAKDASYDADSETDEADKADDGSVLSKVERLIKLIIDFVKYIIESLK